jgi:hypothetical protein
MPYGPVHLVTYEDRRRFGTVVRLEDDVRFVSDFISNEAVVEAPDTHQIFRDTVVRLCSLWQRDFGEHLMVTGGDQEGVDYSFFAASDTIDGEVINVHEVREITDGRSS